MLFLISLPICLSISVQIHYFLFHSMYFVLVVQLLSPACLFATTCTATCQASLSFTLSWNLLKLISIELHATISSSVTPFSSCLQSFPTPGSFPASRLFASGGQSIGASASATVLLMNIQDLFPLGLTGLISLLSKGLSRVSSSTVVQQHQQLIQQSAFFIFQLLHLYMTTGKTIALARWTFVSKVMSLSLLFNILCGFVIPFLLRSSVF